MRVIAAAVILLTGLLGPAYASAQTSATFATQFRDYFTAIALNAGHGARNEVVRQRQVEAVLAAMVTQFLIERPAQVSAVIAGLSAAAPDVASRIAKNAMASFPGFAAQIAQASSRSASQLATPTLAMTQTVPATLQGSALDPRIKIHAARVAAWAVSAIAQNSSALEKIMAHAIAAAPGGETTMVSSVQAAYPGFAQRIVKATGLAAAMPIPALTSQHAVSLAVQPVVSGPRTVSSPQRTLISRPTLGDVARPSDGNEDDGEIDDPLEPMNRIIFAFNDTVDLILLRPIALGYRSVMPDPAVHAVQRFFLNLDSPVILVNDLLQGDFKDARVTLGRFSINSTLGVFGLFDPAAGFGWEHHHADFGQTLHSYDVGAGPYLVLPLLGPASTRNGIGKVVDIFFQPLTYLANTVQSLSVGATRAVVKREELLDPLDELRENSLDFYTGLKAAFWQARQMELGKGALDGPGDSGADKLFDAAD